MTNNVNEHGSDIKSNLSDPPFKIVIWLSIVCVIIIALLDLLGWAFDITLLKSIKEHWITMRVITALCLVFSAISLGLIAMNLTFKTGRILIILMSAFIMGVSILTLYIYFGFFITGNEPALAETSGFRFILAYNDRMAFITALNFFFISIILLLFISENKRNFNIAHIIIIPVSLSSYFIPITYILGEYTEHSFENVPVAINTGIALCGLCIAVLLIKPDTWLLKVFTTGRTGGIIARKLVPPILIIPLLIAWLRIQGENQGLFSSNEGSAYITLIYTLCFLTLVWLTSRSLNHIDNKRFKSEELLRKSYEELEIRVKERTFELLELNKLLDAEIKERKRAQLSVEAERKRSIDILELMPAYLILLTPDYHVAYANKYFRHQFGEDNGRRCYEYLFNRTEPCEICETYKVLKENRSLTWDWTGPNGRNYAIFDFPFKDVDNKTLIMEMGIDVTELKQAQEKLKTINSDLEQRVDERTREYQNAVREIEWYSQKMEILSDVSSRLLASNDPQTLVNELCNRVMKFLNCDVFFNFIVNDQEGKLHLNAFSGIEAEEAAKIEWLEFGTAVCGCAARDGKRIIAENIPSTPDPRTDLIRKFGVKAYCCHPLLSGNKVIGTLSFGTRKRLTYNDEEIALMKTVSDQVAISMSRILDERRLKESEDRFRTIAELLPVQIAITRPSDGVILFTNEMYNTTFGFKKNELQGRKADDLYYSHEDPDKILAELREKGKSIHNEVKVKRADGSDFWIIASTQTITYGTETAYLTASVDITESKRTKDELMQVNRTLNSLGKSSHAMMHSVNEMQYLNEICKLVIECGHKMVWIGYAQQDEEKSVKPVAWYGFDEDYLNQLNITWDDRIRGKGPTGTTIRTGNPSICRDMQTDPAFEPWRSEALKRGYASSVVFPLKTGNKTFGAISIYSNEPDAFSHIELGLLSDLSRDLSYGISYLRLREAESEASQLIRESEEKYRLLFGTMIEGFAFNEIILDQNGVPCDYKFLSINPAFEKQTGLKASEIIGRRVTEVLPGIEKYWIETFGKVAITGESIEFENYSSELDKYFKISSFCPKKGYFAIIFEDISGRRKAEHEVKVAKEKLDMALENAKIGLWEWDIRNNDLFFDKRMESLFNLTHSDAIKKFKDFEEIIYEEDLTHFHAAIDAAIYENIPFDTIFRISHQNGEPNHISSKAIVLKDKTGVPLKMTGVCFDISDMKKGAEQALFTLNENLTRSNRELEQFAYVASHDLQEPLRMVSSFTQLLSMRYKDKLGSDANEFIQYAVDGAVRMQALINDLLEYSRIETRGKALALINMRDALDLAVKNLTIKIKEKKAMISIDKLPVVFADYGQMSQLFQNLISNAIKFCNTSPKIHISSIEENGHYLFSVRDNGIGIESQYFNKIFQIFQRLHGKEEYGGTGIGLSICRRIVERHGGKIWVESKPSEGSVFYFTIIKR